MKIPALQIKQLTTKRLLLIPFTKQICTHFIKNDFSDLTQMGFKKGASWPDHDVIETLPKILHNLSQVEAPTGFESWMIIKKETSEIIGDLGFKGFNKEEKSADLGYGIIKEERRKGYAEEATKTILAWAFSNAFVQKITARCAVDNLGSINLLKKLDFTVVKNEGQMFFWTIKRAK